MDAKKIHVLFILVTSSKARFTDNCEVFGLKNFIDVKTENSSNNVFCLNATDLTIYEVTILHDSKVINVPSPKLKIQVDNSFQALLYQITQSDPTINNKICEISSNKPTRWDCQKIVFLHNHSYPSQGNKVKR